MIITKIQGGLGNQMFQYAIGRQLAYLNDTELKLDTSFYRQNFKNCTSREYSLSHFNIVENITTEEDIKKIKKNNIHNKSIIYKAIRKILKHLEEKKPILKRSYIHEPYFNFCPEILKIKSNKNIYLYGNWQSEKYFEGIGDIICKEFTLKQKMNANIEKMVKDIGNMQSISIHIRRGDYINNQETKKYHGICSLEYYYSAIKNIQTNVLNPHFFIFSDDADWTKKNLKIKNPMTFVSGEKLKDYEELIIMSKCKHNIIANSTFSWWAAWLNNNPAKIVFAPKNWFADSNKNTKDLYHKNWIKL